MKKMILAVFILTGCVSPTEVYDACEITIRKIDIDEMSEIVVNRENVTITEEDNLITISHGEEVVMTSTYDRRNVSYVCFKDNDVLISGDRMVFSYNNIELNEVPEFNVIHLTDKAQYSVEEEIIVKTSIIVGESVDLISEIGGIQNVYNHICPVTDEILICNTYSAQKSLDFNLNFTDNYFTDVIITSYWQEGYTIEVFTSFYYERVKYTYSTLLDIKIN